MSSRSIRILCVDDEPEVLRGLQLHLARLYDVRTAEGGAAALALLQEDPSVDIIVSDMRMPGMNGAEFLARTLAIAPGAQRILLTGHADLTSAIAAVNEGQIFRFLTKPCPPPDLLRTISEAVGRLQASDLERSAVRRRMEHQQSQVDVLTGLASRQALMATLEAAAFDASDSASALTAYFIDVDAADEPLREGDQPWADEPGRVIADRLREQFPAASALARWGADQFVALLPSDDLTDDALIERGMALHRALSAQVPTDPYPVRVDVAIGIARLSDRLHWQRLIQQAVAAARDARAGTSVSLHRPDAPTSAGLQRELLGALRRAIVEGGLHLAYQPIVDVATGRPRAFEALLRWKHETLGYIAPATVIPLLEQNGDIVTLGQWVLNTACREALPLVASGRHRLSVNVSPRQMLDPGFFPHLEGCLARSGLPPDSLTLELTETALAADMERLREVMERVRALQVQLAVDDFGTGYSSLSYLHRLPIDTIKVDGVFVRDFYRGGRTIIKAAMAVALDFEQDVIVEGVETDDMLQQVRELGITQVQGFCFARPMPLHETLHWLRQFEA